VCKPCRYVRSIAPKVHPPRWLVSIALNRFVDQDTYLLATQQSVTLSNELRDIADKQQPAQLQQPQTSDAQVSDRQRADGEAAQAGAPMARRSWYCHRSPTDNILVASGKWMDKAVPWMPNRYQGLLSSSLQGAHLAFWQGLVATPTVVSQIMALVASVSYLCCPGCAGRFPNWCICGRYAASDYWFSIAHGLCLWALLNNSFAMQPLQGRLLCRSAVAFAKPDAGLMSQSM